MNCQKLKRRVELEDLQKRNEVWKTITKEVPCQFSCKYGKVFQITKTKPEKYLLEIDSYYIEMVDGYGNK